MDDLQSSEESAFVVEEVERIVVQAAESSLKDEVYAEERCERWISAIAERVIADLTALRKPFKYACTVAIVQKNGAGTHSANSCHWDTVTDGVVTVKWPGDKHKDQNKTLSALVTVFGCGL